MEMEGNVQAILSKGKKRPGGIVQIIRQCQKNLGMLFEPIP
jgi:hypothetical protein